MYRWRRTHACAHIWYNPLSMDRAGNNFLDIKHTQHSLIHICVYIYIINSLWQTTGASPFPSPRRRQQKTWFGPVACSPGAALWRAPPPRTPSTHSVAVAAVRPWCLPETLLCQSIRLISHLSKPPERWTSGGRAACDAWHPSAPSQQHLEVHPGPARWRLKYLNLPSLFARPPRQVVVDDTFMWLPCTADIRNSPCITAVAHGNGAHKNIAKQINPL